MNIELSPLLSIGVGVLCFLTGSFSKSTIIGQGKFSLHFNKSMKLVGLLWTIVGVLEYINENF
jgi:hypothetical protein